MKFFRVAATGLLLMGLAPLAASADTRINESIDAASDGEVHVSNVAGSVEVQGWNRAQVEVTGRLGDGVEELIFERDGNEVIIKVKLPRKSRRSGSSDLIIKVPEDSSLSVHTVSADIEVEDVLGEQRLEAVSGDIATTVHGAEVDASAVSGDLEIVGNNQVTDVSFETVSGDIESRYLSGEFRAESVSGDISLVEGAFERLRSDTVNGDIELEVQLLEDGRIDIETINGRVDIEFVGALSTEFDIETFNGDIRNCFGPDPVRTSKYTPGRELDFTEGSGAGRVRINTLNGDVILCK